MINCLHHFEILTNSSKKLLKYFINGYNFNLVSSKQNGPYNQYLINSNSINFLITSINTNERLIKPTDQAISNKKDRFSAYSYKTSLETIEQQSRLSILFDKILSKKDTVFNAAFQVSDLDRILSNCQKHQVKIIKDKHMLFDQNYSTDGYVECAIIESCVDGVVHSLFNTKNYNGNFLPGFECESIQQQHTINNLKYFDHLTYATGQNTSNNLIDWYSKVFNMKRLKVEGEEPNGMIVKTGDSGMNLKVINYWLCAETGVEFSNTKTVDDSFKFVISEPLKADGVDADSESVKKNQISIFLEENGGPGIQHIGLFSNDIVKSVQESKKNSNISYYATPELYYKSEDKIKEIESCGLDVNLLKENHILLDTDGSNNQTDISIEATKDRYLLQVFTQPIFDKNTVFLELIQRVGGVKGFGSGNIKALWNAVQSQMNANMKT